MAIPRQLLDSGRLRRDIASLVVLHGAEIGRNFRLRRETVLLGRDPQATVRIHDHLASREHARIECRHDPATGAKAHVLIDLGSTNHTYVNSRQIERTDLHDGDKIQIGDTVFKFTLLDDVEASFHEKIRHRIRYDQLTGLLTKESLYLALGMELERCLRHSLPLAVLMMDLDRFKSVNDTHGHQMGSHVLAEVGRLIRQSIRVEDVSARYGGEEFVSYLPEASGTGAAQAAERIRRAVEEHPFTVDERTIRVTISVGIAVCPQHGCDLTTLVGRADRALYRAKETGRNRVCCEDLAEDAR